MAKPKSPLDEAKENPFRFFSIEDVAEMCGLGRNTMTAIAAVEGSPIIARKCNPHLLMKWLSENAGKVGKIRAD